MLWNAGHFFKLAIFYEKNISVAKLPTCGQSLTETKIVVELNCDLNLLNESPLQNCNV